jgi:asparagine synthase (glutamine-hydrolysing)
MCGIMFVEGEIKQELFDKGFEAIRHRGPDESRTLMTRRGMFGFHRLAIVDLSPLGMQPFMHEGLSLVCNGEIYNEADIRNRYNTYPYQGHSDCEVLLPLYMDQSSNMGGQVDGEFVFILYDEHQDRLMVGRDPLGIRPLFYGKQSNGYLAFASEAKALLPLCEHIEAFPIGTIYDNGRWIKYEDVSKTFTPILSHHEIMTQIHDTLSQSVEKRLMADAPVGYLLSGGLDSSLVCSIAARLSSQALQTFAIGMKADAIDLKYAKQVAQHIGSDHHEIIMTIQDVIEVLPKVIYHLETYDITTIRASLGMYLLAKAIHEQTDIKVLLTGEVSDELFGYKYTDFAPNAEAFNCEAQKRLKELYAYDVLRADRCLAAWSLEARVPFSDLNFIQTVMSIDPRLKMNTTGMGKLLLRQAFDRDDYLPSTILWREKAAFSDAVGHSMVDEIKQYCDQLISDDDFLKAKDFYQDICPHTKEALLYRRIFESFYPRQAHLIPAYWMPNPAWVGEQIQDPSARYLTNYNLSGV